jgi:O-antigen/teichoic acid export membrane protein
MVDILPGEVLKSLKRSLIGINSRFFGTLLRFFIPILIMYLSTEEQLGIYYLSLSTLITFSSFFGLEFGFFYSKLYLNAEYRDRTSVFNEFIFKISCLLLPFILIACIIFVFFSLLNVSLFFYIFVTILIFFECISFEIGRFMWNIGEAHQASFRDFIKSIFLVIACASSLVMFQEILTTFTIIFLIAGNICIILFEIHRWGDVFKFKKLKDSFILKNFIRENYIFLKKHLAISGPQFIQNQSIAFNMLIERLLITSTLGLATVGIYSFIYSVLQTGSSLFFMPNSAKTKEMIIKGQPMFKNPEIFSTAIQLIRIIFTYVFVCACSLYLIIPYLGNILDFNFGHNALLIIFVLIFATSSNSYMAGVSPLFSSPRDWYIPNIISFLVLLPYVLLIALSLFSIGFSEFVIFSIILFISLLQISIRVVRFKKSLSFLNRNIYNK